MPHPYPIIFGAKDKQKPFPQLNFVTVAGRQYVFSRSNYNLFPTPEEAKYLSFGDLLEASNRGVPPWARGSSVTSELIFAPEICYQCTERTLGCPLVVKNTETKMFTTERGEKLEVLWWILKKDREIDDWNSVCPFFQALLDLTETKAERKFLRLYLDDCLGHFLHEMQESLVDQGPRYMESNIDRISDILKSEFADRISWAIEDVRRRFHGRIQRGEGVGQEGVPPTVALFHAHRYDRSKLVPKEPPDGPLRRRELVEEGRALSSIGFKANLGTAANLRASEIFDLGNWLRRALKLVPALIPQVWLRHIYDPHLGPKDLLKDKEAISRADFVMLWRGKRTVIEIDGPEHYAKWDKDSRKWEVSEEKYTLNLRKERRLIKEGWLVVRLSNQEVESAESWYDIDILVDLAEFIEPPWELPPDYPSPHYFG